MAENKKELIKKLKVLLKNLVSFWNQTNLKKRLILRTS
ncbi:hypothetical protein STRDD04_01037 [Streptococcus sp. DD04]|nr:hypothetical protein STRDD04_01037 [Streptococcus sp. DD04]